jgi:hypothetical protein
MKVCKRCNIEFEDDKFSKCSANKDGLQRWCRECSKKRKKEWDRENIEHVRKYSTEYHNIHNEYEKLYSKEYRQKNLERCKEYDKNHYQLNKEREKEYARRRGPYYYLLNKDIIKEKVMKYQANNKDRVRSYKLKNKILRKNKLKNGINDYTTDQWLECIEYFNHKCVYCGIKTNVLTQDHIIPLIKDGGHTKNNIVPSCFSCNSSKNDKDLKTWYINHPNYTEERLNKILQYISQR